MSTVHVVVPAGIDDPARPSGGNRYDRRLCTALAEAGWRVRELQVEGRWPTPAPAAQQQLGATVAGVPDDDVLLVDGLVASAAPAIVSGESRRLRIVVLVHMPLGGVEVPADDEHAVLTSARAVVATSEWARSALVDRYGLDADRVAVARPGVDHSELTEPTPGGERLLCVGAVAPHKGQDVLVQALAGLTHQTWRCTLVGQQDRDLGFTARLRQQIADAALIDRVTLTGPARPAPHYGDADLLILPSRLEAYGMVVTEALAAGVPVVASDVGGVREAVGTTFLGEPGLLVAPGDPQSLRDALAAWLADDGLRHGLRRAAAERRRGLAGWTATAEQVAAVLGRVRGEPERVLPRGPR